MHVKYHFVVESSQCTRCWSSSLVCTLSVHIGAFLCHLNLMMLLCTWYFFFPRQFLFLHEFVDGNLSNSFLLLLLSLMKKNVISEPDFEARW